MNIKKEKCQYIIEKQNRKYKNYKCSNNDKNLCNIHNDKIIRKKGDDIFNKIQTLPLVIVEYIFKFIDPYRKEFNKFIKNINLQKYIQIRNFIKMEWYDELDYILETYGTTLVSKPYHMIFLLDILYDKNINCDFSLYICTCMKFHKYGNIQIFGPVEDGKICLEEENGVEIWKDVNKNSWNETSRGEFWTLQEHQWVGIIEITVDKVKHFKYQTMYGNISKPVFEHDNKNINIVYDILKGLDIQYLINTVEYLKDKAYKKFKAI
jgi:hypothetical protein